MRDPSDPLSALRISFTVDAGDLEDAYDVLLPLLPGGVHERELDGGRRELSWFAPAGEASRQEELTGRLEKLADAWRVEPAPEDAAARRARYGRVWNVAGRIVIRGPGDPPAPAGVPEIVIESVHGEFGTGAHPTTRQSLELLLDIEPAGALADLGCGSGVLAIAAARLGHAPIVAVDFEPASVEATALNAARNEVHVEAYEADLRDVPPPPAATLAANLPLAVHRAMAAALDERTGTVIASGLTADEADEGAAAYAAAGFTVTRRIDGEGWTTLLLERAA